MQGPRLYRFFNYEQIAYVAAPVGGWNPDANPWLVPANQAPVLDNFLIRQGKIITRGGFKVAADLTADGPLDIAGMVPGGQILLARKNPNGGTVDPWNAPLLANTSSALASGESTMIYANTQTGVLTSVTPATADGIVGPRWINFDGLLYGLSYDSAGSAIQDAGNSYFIKPYSLFTLTKAASANNVVASPSAAANNSSVGTLAWQNTTNLPGLSFCGAATNGTFQSEYLVCTDYGFSIPTGATIVGIEVSFGKLASGTGSVSDAAIRLVKAGVPLSTGDHSQSGTWPTVSETTFTYGGANDLWSNSWAPSDINNSGFGVAISASVTSPGSEEIAIIQALDTVDITVYYEVANTQPLPVPAVNAPHGAIDLKGHQGRIWLLGGCNPPGIGAAPTGLTLGTLITSGGSWGSTGTYSWAITAVSASGESAITNIVTASIGSTADEQPLSWTAAPGATSYNIYRVAGTANPFSFVTPCRITNVTTTAYTDTGTSPTSGAPPSISTGPHHCTALYFTNGVNTSAGTGTLASDWQDPVQGTTNVIVIDNNSADFGVGLAEVRNGLLILRRNSLWFLKGTTTANYQIYPISQETGCYDARSIVETDHGVYFVGPKGLMLSDGVKVLNASGTVMYTLQQAIAAEQASVINGFGGYITCGLTSQGQILVTIGATQAGGHIAPIWCGLYDPSIPKAGGWIRITSQLWENDGIQPNPNNYYPGQIVWQQTPHQLYVVGDNYLTQLEDQSEDQSFLIQAALYDQLPSGAAPYLSIPAVWSTKLYPIAGIATNLRRWGSAKRYFFDYVFGADGLVPTTGWTVTPVNASNTSYNAVLSADLGSAPTTTGSVTGVTAIASPVIQRQGLDILNEIDDIGFEVAWSDSTARSNAPTNVVAEIYGIGLEWQKSRERR